jgi:hypothetical protein
MKLPKWVLLGITLLVVVMVVFLMLPPPEKVVPHVTSRITYDESTKWRTYTLVVKDQDGNPLSGVEVSYEQTDIDFMFSVEYEAIPYDLFKEEYEKMYYGLGLNTIRFGAYWSWAQLEPQKEEFNWFYEYPEGFHSTADLGLHLPNFEEDSKTFPEWTEPEDIDGKFKQDYEEFVKAFVSYYNGTVDVYRLGLEANDGRWSGAAQGKSYDWATDWLKWQCSLIKETDPDAKISIDLAPEILLIREGNPQELDWTRLPPPKPMWEMEFIQKLIDKEVDFDIIGIELHPGLYCNLQDVREYLYFLEPFHRPIYIWQTVIASADTPFLAEEALVRGCYPAGGFTEEYQKEQILGLFEIAIENPKVIGIEYLSFVDDPHNRWSSNERFLYGGLLREDGTPKPAYYALRDYWHSLFTIGQATTDQNGEITFNALPGTFTIRVDGEVTEIEEEVVEEEPCPVCG